MSGRQRRTQRDQRRRAYGQNFLVDRGVVRRFLSCAELRRDELVIELGAGTGVLTRALAAAGVRVVAVERDPVWASRLRSEIREAGMASRARVVEADLRRVRLPKESYRVVASPPFCLTTEVLSLLLDDPDGGPWRADLLLQREVALKRAAEPPTSLRSAAWAPWWAFEVGETVGRHAFRPVPRVDAAWLTVRKRTPPILPTWLSADFSSVLRASWTLPHRRRR
ncbi:MAG: methyltransferase domain-containing protein [Euzebyales bacterium]|nr:methyltransferase domain-containing protein [Euzebyales bacterium]